MIKKKVVKSIKLSKTKGTDIVPEMSETSTSFDNVEIKNRINKLDVDLGRGDLNMLRDKINEVIEILWP